METLRDVAGELPSRSQRVRRKPVKHGDEKGDEEGIEVLENAGEFNSTEEKAGGGEYDVAEDSDDGGGGREGTPGKQGRRKRGAGSKGTFSGKRKRRAPPNDTPQVVAAMPIDSKGTDKILEDAAEKEWMLKRAEDGKMVVALKDQWAFEWEERLRLGGGIGGPLPAHLYRALTAPWWGNRNGTYSRFLQCYTLPEGQQLEVRCC